MSNATKSVTLSFPFLQILTLIFVTLKLTGFINWSWGLVLLPLYGPILLVAILCILFFAVCMIAEYFSKK